MRAFMLSLALASSAAPAAAQSSAPDAPPPASEIPPVLTRFGFHIDMAPYLTDDPRFTWGAVFGADADIWDYGRGRLIGLAAFEIVLGKFLDPSQNNYVIEFASSLRLPRSIEGSVFFHHVSRHLSDRAKRTKVAWNIVGLRVDRRRLAGRSRLDTRLEAGWMTVARAFVDYRWKTVGSARWLYRLHDLARPLVNGEVTLMGVHEDEARRTTQIGGRVEAGLRLPARGADCDVFVAYERRIDPYPTERGIGTWGLVGVRILSR